MQMTGYELLANYEKAEDKDKQIQILSDLNHIPVDMVCFVIENREKFENLETPLSAEEFAKWCETEQETFRTVTYSTWLHIRLLMLLESDARSRMSAAIQ